MSAASKACARESLAKYLQVCPLADEPRELLQAILEYTYQCGVIDGAKQATKVLLPGVVTG